MSEQLALRFDGQTYDAARDRERLTGEYAAVWRVMADEQWHTPPELEQRTGYSWASISARLRDFRKKRNGDHTVLREYVENGLWRYRLVINRAVPVAVEAGEAPRTPPLK